MYHLRALSYQLVLILFRIYYTKIKLGSPPKEFNVQIDTGSDALWVACSTCNDCPKSSGLGVELKFFDVGSSTTAAVVSCSHPTCSAMVQTSAASCSSESNQCGYSFLYGDGNGTSGLYFSDLLYFDTILGPSLVANSSSPIVFGCSSYQSGDLTSQAHAIDGIFGFSPHDLSVISQLSSQGITPKVFSHCLIGSGNGGATPLSHHKHCWTMLPINSAVFTTSSNRGTIVDSGTTLAYLVGEAYDLLSVLQVLFFPKSFPFGRLYDRREVNAAVLQYATPVAASTGHQCYIVSTSSIEMFPLVVLYFAGGASMVLRPKDYLIYSLFGEGAARWCIGFVKVQGRGVNILGDIVLKDKIFVYDLARQRLGWADYDCSSSINVSITIGKDEFINSGELSASRSSKTSWYFNLIITMITTLVHISLFDQIGYSCFLSF